MKLTGPTLFIDQHGDPVWARTVKELREKCGGGKVSKQYVDKKDGRTVHNGYVVGHRWFTAFKPIEEEGAQWMQKSPEARVEETL